MFERSLDTVVALQWRAFALFLALFFCLFVVACGNIAITGIDHIPGGDLLGGEGGPGDGDGNGGSGDRSGRSQTDSFSARYTQQTDILAVIDNSGSMSQERTAVRDNMGGFHSKLNSRRINDYRLAVCTTDAYSHQGALVSYLGTDIVTSNTGNAVSTVQGILGQIVNSTKSYWEQGLKSAEIALTVNKDRLLRSGTDLAVIYISDEEDYSCIAADGSFTGRDCPGLSNSNTQPESISPRPWTHVGLDHYQQFFQSLNRSVLLYPIVGIDGKNCSESSKGRRYQNLQALIGTGMTQAICNSELASNFTRIADAISARGDCYRLSEPAQNSPSSFRVTVNGNTVSHSASSGFSFDAGGNAVCFKGSLLPAAGSTISVTYPVAQ